jgi:hypothetical protein
MKDLEYVGDALNVKNDFADVFDDLLEEQQEALINANESRKSDTLALSRTNVWSKITVEQLQPLLVQAKMIADGLEHLAVIFEEGRMASIRPAIDLVGSFWDFDRYGSALRLFGTLLRTPEAPFFVERIDDDDLIEAGMSPYSHIIKHPLSFLDIAKALIQYPSQITGTHAYNDGRLAVRGLASWNMWRGNDLLQAIDLVFLNCMAYGKAVDEGRSVQRSNTNKLRKMLWNGINEIVVHNVGGDLERKKQHTPTRRSESSGFVVYKIKER